MAHGKLSPQHFTVIITDEVNIRDHTLVIKRLPFHKDGGLPFPHFSLVYGVLYSIWITNRIYPA